MYESIFVSSVLSLDFIVIVKALFIVFFLQETIGSETASVRKALEDIKDKVSEVSSFLMIPNSFSLKIAILVVV